MSRVMELTGVGGTQEEPFTYPVYINTENVLYVKAECSGKPDGWAILQFAGHTLRVCEPAVTVARCMDLAGRIM